jgi:hypothetical protein
MVIGEEMFTGGQEGGEGVRKQSKYMGSSNSRNGQRSGISPDCASCKPRADITQHAPNPLAL